MRRRLAGLPALLLAVALALPACKKEGPADRYLAFVAAARKGDSEAVWSMLSRRAQDGFDARAKAAAAAAPGVVPASGAALVLGDRAASVPKARTAVVVRESKDAAVVLVEDEAGAKGEVALVREGGDWKVDLEP